MRHQHHLLHPQRVKYRLQIPLLRWRCRVVRRFIRGSPTEKVEGDDLATTQIRNQAVINVEVIWKPCMRINAGPVPA